MTIELKRNNKQTLKNFNEMCENVTTETSLSNFQKKTCTKSRLMNIIKNSDGP